MTAANCGLSADELAAQLDRYRTLGCAAGEVEHAPGGVVVRFVQDPPAGLLERTMAVERGGCPFFQLDYDMAVRRLTITTQDAEHRAGLDALAQVLTQRGATGALPPTVGNERAADDPTRAARFR